MNDLKETVELLLATGRGLAPLVENPDGKKFAFIPANFKAEDVSRFFPPQRIEQRVTLIESGSFSDYVNRYKSANTVIFAEVTDQGARFEAILDYHQPGETFKPAYNAHRAVYETSPTTEWVEWMAVNCKWLSQVEFATWLEDHAKLFREPAGADLLELVTTLVGKSDVRFNSAIRLQSGGANLTYDEDVVVKGTSTTRNGDFELPQMVTAGIAAFQGMAAYEINARLKYRIENRKLMLKLETVQPHRIVRECVAIVMKEIADKTAVIPFIGKV